MASYDTPLDKNPIFNNVDYTATDSTANDVSTLQNNLTNGTLIPALSAELLRLTFLI